MLVHQHAGLAHLSLFFCLFFFVLQLKRCCVACMGQGMRAKLSDALLTMADPVFLRNVVAGVHIGRTTWLYHAMCPHSIVHMAARPSTGSVLNAQHPRR